MAVQFFTAFITVLGAGFAALFFLLGLYGVFFEDGTKENVLAVLVAFALSGFFVVVTRWLIT